MVDWKTHEELVTDADVFSKLMHVLLGLYLWEFGISFNFEWDLFRGKKKFHWPLIFYFTGRYSLLFALMGIVISLDITSKINCQALYIFNQMFGNAAIGIASLNLSLRTIAIWSRSIYVVVPIICLILGHWSLLLHGLLIRAAWVPAEGGCVITDTNNTLLAAIFIYSMVFDLFVLLLTGYKLAFPINSRQLRMRSSLVKLVFRDGLIFFIVAFLANLVATIFMLLNLNAVMSVIFNVPAAIVSTIVASRAVRRLSNFASKSPEIFPSTTPVSRFAMPIGQSMGEIPEIAKPDGVHIQMDTFAFIEIPQNTKIRADASQV